MKKKIRKMIELGEQEQEDEDEEGFGVFILLYGLAEAGEFGYIHCGICVSLAERLGF